MKLRAFDIILLLVILIGGVLAWRTGRERDRLWETYRRLSQKTGDLAVGDPSKVYAQALKTGDPMHFAWRVRLPPNYRASWKESSGGSSGSWSAEPVDCIVRIRFREDKEGSIDLYTRFGGSSGRMGFGGEDLAKLLRGRWDKLRVDQLGVGEVATIGPDKPAVFLRLTMSEEMQAEARRELSSSELKTYIPNLFELGLEPEKTPKP